MKRTINIPIYSTLSPKHRQIANLVIGGTACMILVLFVSGMLNGPEQVKGPAGIKGGPKPHAMAAQLPGENLDPKDVWVGGAQKDVARMHDDLRQGADRDRQRDEAQDRINKEVLATLKDLKEAKATPATLAVTTAASGAAAPAPVTPPATGASQAKPSAMSAGTFPPQPRTGDRIPAPGAGAYPPGTPGRMAVGSFDSGYAPPPTLVHVALKVPGEQGDALKATVGTASRRVDSYLPVGFTRATILGGLAAPTGGQAQSNPVPAIFRLSDASILPNHFRAQVRDCMVIGEGFGDQSSERAYIRTTLLSCVMKDGHVLEVPIKGQVFGEDGMNGVMGKLVTKQGQILTNALLSGIASGLGQGLSAASTVTTTSALGTVSTVPTDAGSILKSSAGTGVGKALDRLSQYYISLAEKTFPVIEVLPGRTVDIVLTQGVQLDTTLGIAASGQDDARAPRRSDLLDVLHDEH